MRPDSKAASHLAWCGAVTNRAEASSLLRSPGDAVLVERGRPRLLVLACPCGCGEELPVNLDSRAGPAWRLYRGRGGTSLFPSVWRESGCESHFVIWRDKILLFGASRDLDEVAASPLSDEDVFDELTDSSFRSFDDIADALDAVPWDVLSTCRRLVREARVVEGRGSERSCFKRA